MKKILLAVLVLVMLAGAALAQETAGFSFATLGDAMASESYTGIAGGDDQHFNVVVTLNGAPHRLTADLDDKARELAEGTLESVEADAVEAAFEAYNAYIRTLPVTREEEITAQPKSREELEELVGKTLLEVEAAGYEHGSSEMGADDTAVYTVSFGMYDYNLLLNETYTEYREHDENGYIAVIMGSENSSTLYKSMTKLLSAINSNDTGSSSSGSKETSSSSDSSEQETSSSSGSSVQETESE